MSHVWSNFTECILMKVAIFISDIATKIGSNGSLLIIYSRNLSWNWIPFHLLWPLPRVLSVSSCSFLLPCHLICCYQVCVSQKHTLHTRQDNVFQNWSLTAVYVWLNPVWLNNDQNLCRGSHHPPILGLAHHIRKEPTPHRLSRFSTLCCLDIPHVTP